MADPQFGVCMLLVGCAAKGRSVAQLQDSVVKMRHCSALDHLPPLIRSLQLSVCLVDSLTSSERPDMRMCYELICESPALMLLRFS